MASCSSDQCVSVWVRRSSWNIACRMMQHQGAVVAVKFGRPWGQLQVAACCGGHIFIYTADDLNELSSWSPTEIDLGDCIANCLDWSTCRFSPTCLAVGTSTALQLWRWSGCLWSCVWTRTENVSQVAWAPRLGRSFDCLAVASGSDNCVSLRKLNCEDTEPEPEEMFVLSTKSKVYHMAWDLFGNIIVCSGDDFVVSWQRDLSSAYLSSAWKKCHFGDE